MQDAQKTKLQVGNREASYSKGISLGLVQHQVGDFESIDYTGRAAELMEILTSAQALTSGAAAVALDCSRRTAATTFNSLWWAGMARRVNVFAANNGEQRGLFRLWFSADVRSPRNAQEACRLAVLGFFYSRAKNEVPGFEWQVIRKTTGAVVEMRYATADGRPERWLIDAPRHGEEPLPDADVYIFPSVRGGRELAPIGKIYTADEVLLAPGGLQEKLFRKTT